MKHGCSNNHATCMQHMKAAQTMPTRSPQHVLTSVDHRSCVATSSTNLPLATQMIYTCVKTPTHKSARMVCANTHSWPHQLRIGLLHLSICLRCHSSRQAQSPYQVTKMHAGHDHAESCNFDRLAIQSPCAPQLSQPHNHHSPSSFVPWPDGRLCSFCGSWLSPLQ